MILGSNPAVATEWIYNLGDPSIKSCSIHCMDLFEVILELYPALAFVSDDPRIKPCCSHWMDLYYMILGLYPALAFVLDDPRIKS